MVPYRYEEISHTADLALRVWGENFHDMLCHAAQGMYHLMGAGFDKNTPTNVAFTITNASPEEILVDFLNELLFLCEARGKVLAEFQFSEATIDLQVKSVCYALEDLVRPIKAVTFHNLAINQFGNGYETIITFDV